MIQMLDQLSKRREWLVLAVLLAVIGAFYIATIRTGHAWGDDFALYLLEARNLATGQPFEQTGYIYDPDEPQIGPRAYPPVYPLLLSLVYRFDGFDLKLMKIEGILGFLAGLAVMAWLFRTYLPFPLAAGAMAVFALNPYSWSFKDSITSDLVFLFPCYLALYLATREHLSYTGETLLIAAIYVAFATRTVGLILIPALVSTEFIRTRRIPPWVVRVVAGAGFLILAHALIFRGTNSYADQLSHISIVRIWTKLVVYFWGIRHALWMVDGVIVSLIVTLVMIAMGVIGYAVRLSREVSILEVFTVFYVVLIFLWANNEDLRFFLPVIPLWVFYVIVAIQRQCQLGRVWRAATGALASLLLASYLHAYVIAGSGPIPEGLEDSRFQQLCAYIRANTPAASVLIFAKPKVLALEADRKVSVATHGPDDRMWSYIDKLAAGYIVVSPLFPEDYAVLEPFVERNGDRLKPIFSNDEFRLFAIGKAK